MGEACDEMNVAESLAKAGEAVGKKVWHESIFYAPDFFVPHPSSRSFTFRHKAARKEC